MNGKRKVVLVGTGMVGMSFAFAALNQHLFDELVLIDMNKERAIGEAMDLNHSLAFSGMNMNIYAGDYYDTADADIVVIAAGVSQKPGESRMDLLKKNAAIMKSIVDSVVKAGFEGLFLIASNPVDVMTKVAYDVSGFNPYRVIGSGTALDTARLRYILGNKLYTDPQNIHAYVMGEHGDSEFIPWSQAMMSTKPINQIIPKTEQESMFQEIETQVRDAAQKIIKAKRATYYGIGMALCRIVRTILGNQRSILTVSAMLKGEYGERDVFIGVPAIIGKNGIQSVIELELSKEEINKLHASCDTLRDAFAEL
ncbi:MAG: L-lactate dehydrogenase [Bacilli bacterium]|nr:L-lactate dehydrogenase [Bacilli bacterium]